MYKIINVIPLIWGPSGTVEYRVHPPTLHPDKVLNWLFICNAITKYAYIHREYISNFGTLSNIDLSSILETCYSSKLSNLLNSYVDFRKTYMKKMDSKGHKELMEDLTIKIPSIC